VSGEVRPDGHAAAGVTLQRGASLSARDAVVSLGGRRVLDGSSIDIAPGKMTGIIGPNGSGKTTLLRALAGLVQLDSGSIAIGESLLTGVPTKERARRIAFMPQSSGDHAFRALELVLTGRYPHLGRFRLEGRADMDVARAAMRKTGTLEFANRRMQTLSGGEQQRVSLARVLAQTADVLLLDEPTASLDMRHQLLTMAIARDEANEGVAVGVVMHDLSLAAQYCDTLHLLHQGRVYASGKPWDVVTQENLRKVFSVDAAVEPESISGRPAVSLIGLTGGANRSASHIHLICGAGSGRDLMHRLSLAGYGVTACVLGIGDADANTATRLGITFVSSQPFSVISLEQDTTHRRLVRQADVVVVCEMAIGPGNLKNLEAAAEARRLILIERPAGSSWDYTNGAATKVRRELEERGETAIREQVVALLVGVT
jgi:iron complex transport system ATP-binding protein